jgi:hypothetical protein
MGTDAIGWSMEYRRDVQIAFEYTKPTLDVGQTFAPCHAPLRNA